MAEKHLTTLQTITSRWMGDWEPLCASCRHFLGFKTLRAACVHRGARNRNRLMARTFDWNSFSYLFEEASSVTCATAELQKKASKK